MNVCFVPADNWSGVTSRSCKLLSLLLLVSLSAGIAQAVNQPPSVSITSPTGVLLSEGDSYTIEADASDPDGSIERVEFYANNLLLGGDSSKPYTLVWSNLVIGDYELTAIAVDNLFERGTSVVARITVGAAGPKSLRWTPGSTVDWDGAAFNWQTASGAKTIFHSGDSVSFNSRGPVFIGSGSTPGNVSPGAMSFSWDPIFYGGDILTGSMTVGGGSSAVFSNYSGSLSFRGGTTLVLSPAHAELRYNIASAANGAAVHFGTGPITLQGGVFIFEIPPNQTATLENDFIIDYAGTIVTRTVGANFLDKASIRFSGAVRLGGNLGLGFSNQQTDAAPHEWRGPVILEQADQRYLALNFSGGYFQNGLIMSGPISDGPGVATNRLEFGDYALPFVRFTGSNTYANGTRILRSPSAPAGVLEVAPQSSLGSGNVVVEAGGALRLMGNNNVASNRSVTLDGTVILDAGVKARISSLTLGGVTYTTGLFSATNSSFHILSNGTFRLPATNLPPSIAMTNPVEGSVFGAGELFRIRVAIADQDSYIDRVVFRMDDAVIGVRTNPGGFSLTTFSITNAPSGRHALQATVYDDDGGAATSQTIHVIVSPRIDLVERGGSNEVVVQLKTPVNQSYSLQGTEKLLPSIWTNLFSFPAEISSRTLRITNVIPLDTPSGFYRISLP